MLTRRVGDMFKFGRSTRMYILGGPDELRPEEGLTRDQRRTAALLEVQISFCTSSLSFYSVHAIAAIRPHVAKWAPFLKSESSVRIPVRRLAACGLCRAEKLSLSLLTHCEQ